MTTLDPRPPSSPGAAGHGDRSLGECEEVIERGLATFVDVGRALAEIRDGRLYRVTHDTFEGYCQERWGMSRPRAYELIGAAETVAQMSGMSDIPVENARQAAALSPVIRDLGPEAAAEILQEQAATGRVTASGITEAARRRADAYDPAITETAPADPFAGWSKAERDALADFQSTRRSLVVNMSSTAPVGARIWAWAERNGRAVRIDRRTDWGNPFILGEDGDRAEVIARFAEHYLPYKPGLLAALPELKGKILGCWCAPLACHGHVLVAEAYS